MESDATNLCSSSELQGTGRGSRDDENKFSLLRGSREEVEGQLTRPQASISPLCPDSRHFDVAILDWLPFLTSHLCHGRFVLLNGTEVAISEGPRKFRSSVNR